MLDSPDAAMMNYPEYSPSKWSEATCAEILPGDLQVVIDSENSAPISTCGSDTLLLGSHSISSRTSQQSNNLVNTIAGDRPACAGGGDLRVETDRAVANIRAVGYKVTKQLMEETLPCLQDLLRAEVHKMADESLQACREATLETLASDIERETSNLKRVITNESSSLEHAALAWRAEIEKKAAKLATQVIDPKMTVIPEGVAASDDYNLDLQTKVGEACSEALTQTVPVIIDGLNERIDKRLAQLEERTTGMSEVIKDRVDILENFVSESVAQHAKDLAEHKAAFETLCGKLATVAPSEVECASSPFVNDITTAASAVTAQIQARARSTSQTPRLGGSLGGSIGAGIKGGLQSPHNPSLQSPHNPSSQSPHNPSLAAVMRNGGSAMVPVNVARQDSISVPVAIRQESASVPVHVPRSDSVSVPVNVPRSDSVSVPVRGPRQDSVSVPVNSVSVPVNVQRQESVGNQGPPRGGFMSPRASTTPTCGPAPQTVHTLPVHGTRHQQDSSRNRSPGAERSSVGANVVQPNNSFPSNAVVAAPKAPMKPGSISMSTPRSPPQVHRMTNQGTVTPRGPRSWATQ